MGVIECQNCGAAVNDAAIACPECGADPSTGLDAEGKRPTRFGSCLSCGRQMTWGTPVCPGCGNTLTWYERGQVPAALQVPAEPSMQVRIAQGKVASGKRLKAEDKLALMTYEKSQGRQVSGLEMTTAAVTVVYKLFWLVVFLVIMGVVLYACFTAHP